MYFSVNEHAPRVIGLLLKRNSTDLCRSVSNRAAKLSASYLLTMNGYLQSRPLAIVAIDWTAQRRTPAKAARGRVKYKRSDASNADSLSSSHLASSQSVSFAFFVARVDRQQTPSIASGKFPLSLRAFSLNTSRQSRQASENPKFQRCCSKTTVSRAKLDTWESTSETEKCSRRARYRAKHTYGG